MTKNDDSKPTLSEQAEAAFDHNQKKAAARTARQKSAPKVKTLRTRFTQEKKARYLEVIRETGDGVLARWEVGIKREVIYDARKKDPKFKDAEEEMLRVWRAGIKREVQRRGKEGVDEPVFWNGLLVGFMTKYSDRLLELHVKAHCPEYRDKVTVTNEDADPAERLMEDLDKLPAGLRAELEEILEKVAAAQTGAEEGE